MPSPVTVIVQGEQILVYGINIYASAGPMLAIVSLTSTTGGGTALATPTSNVAGHHQPGQARLARA